MLVTWPSSSYTEPIETGHYLGSEDLGGDHMVFGGNGGDVSCFSERLVGGGGMGGGYRKLTVNGEESLEYYKTVWGIRY